MRQNSLAYLAVELDSLKSQGLCRKLRVLEGEQRPTPTVDHRQVVNLSSNNYLGLTTHPRLREAAVNATETYGLDSGSVRTIGGTMAVHIEREERLADFTAGVFQSGFTATCIAALDTFSSVGTELGIIP